MERYTVCLELASGQKKEIDVRCNRAVGAARVAIFAHDEESPIPIRNVLWVAVEGARA